MSSALPDADQDAVLREEIARAGFAGWYGRDEYDEHPVQGMWERAADAIMRGPLATLRSRATAAEDKLKDREAEIERLKIAFHDAIRRPLGVTPGSGAEFYDHRMADQAEERRAEARRASQEPGTGGER